MFPERFEDENRIDTMVVDDQVRSYAIPNQHLDYVYQGRGIPIGYLRGVGGGYTVWAIAGFPDVLAHAIGTDPVSLRLSLLEQPRARRVLEAVTDMATWQKTVTTQASAWPIANIARPTLPWLPKWRGGMGATP